MKNKFNNFFKDIKVSKELDEKIYNNTIYKKELSKGYILKPVIVILILFIFLGVGVMAKEYIEDYIFQMKDTEKLGKDTIFDLELNGKLNVNSNFNCKNNITHEELEDGLNIKLLKFNSFNKDTYNICELTLDNNKNIRTVKLQNDDNYSEYDMNNEETRKKKYLQVDINFMTQYATKNDEKDFKNISILKGTSSVSKFLETYHIEKLNLDVNIIKWSESKYWPQTFCTFVYNNIFYNIQGYNVSKDELIDILNNVEL